VTETAQTESPVPPYNSYEGGGQGRIQSRMCVISRGKVSLLDRCQTQIFLAVTGL